MDVKRSRFLQELSSIRKKRKSDRNSFGQAFTRNPKRVLAGDHVLIDVFLVEWRWRNNKVKEAIEQASESLKKHTQNQDLRCLLGLMYYQKEQFKEAFSYFNQISWRTNSKKSIYTAFGDFRDTYWSDGTVASNMRASLDLMVACLFYRARLQFDINSDTRGAIDSWRECLDLITTNAKARAQLLRQNNNYVNDIGPNAVDSHVSHVTLAPEYNDSPSLGVASNSRKNRSISPYSFIAYNCIVNICQIWLQLGHYSKCLNLIRQTFPSLSYFEDFFHRKILFKIGLICFNYLSAVDWNNCLKTLTSLTKLAISALKSQAILDTTDGQDDTNASPDVSAQLSNLSQDLMKGKDVLSDYSRFESFLSKSYVYSPKSQDEDCILALMVHQRLCQVILQQSTKHSQRQRHAELRKQQKYEKEQRIAREKAYQQHVLQMKQLNINDINFDQESSVTASLAPAVSHASHAPHASDASRADGVYFNGAKRQSSPLINIVPDGDDMKSGASGASGANYSGDEKEELLRDDDDVRDAYDPDAAGSDAEAMNNNEEDPNNDAPNGVDRDVLLSPDASGADGIDASPGDVGATSIVGNYSNQSDSQTAQPEDLTANESIRQSRSQMNASVGKDGYLPHETLILGGYSEYILSQAEQNEIEAESRTSLLFLTILLSGRKEHNPLVKLLLRSVNESQIDCSRWYKYGVALFASGNMGDAMRACWHCLQSDTVVTADSYMFDLVSFQTNRVKNGVTQFGSVGTVVGAVATGGVASKKLHASNGNDANSMTRYKWHKLRKRHERELRKMQTGLLRHHFCLSACILASKCAYLMDDSKTALNYARAAVRLSLDKEFIPRCSTSVVLADQRQTAYLMFSIACTQEAYKTHNFEDRKALHQLGMKAVVRCYLLAPFNENVVFNLACTRADLGDVESALDDTRSLLTKLHAYHSESWHLLSLLLSCKRRWMECYRAVEQALRYNDFAMTLNGLNWYQRHTSLRVYYRYKLEITKCKILMKQNRVTAPLEILRNLAKSLDFNEQFYKNTNLPNSRKVGPLFQPIQNKNDELVQFSGAKGLNGTSARALLKVRCEYLITLSEFYLSRSVNVAKYAYQCMEFALQFFGSKFSTKMNVDKDDASKQDIDNSTVDSKEQVSFSDNILSDIYYQLGKCSVKLSDLNMALTHFQTCISYNHCNCDGLIGLAKIEFELANYYDAKSFVDSALKINATNYNAWSVLGQIQEKLGQYEDASNSFLTSLELERNEPIEPFSTVPRWLD